MEIITYGGGVFLVDVLNAVASIVGTGAFGSALRLAFLLGLLLALIHVVAQHNVFMLVRWFVTSLLIYLCLMVPKTQVVVTDRLDPAFGGAIVDNVPIGIATVASWTTLIGDEFTQLAESAFSLPDDLTYTSNGYIFGSALVRESFNFQLADQTFERNVSSYIRGCVFYDIHTKVLSVDELKNSTDIWSTITTNPNPARSILYQPAPTGAAEVRTCDVVADMLNSQWTAAINQVATLAGRAARPGLTDAAARALILTQLAESHDFFFGVAQSGEDTIRQATLANLLLQAVRDEGAELGADALVEAYTQARTDTEAASALEQGARIASRFVPLLRTVAEIVFYGLFPIVFPIFLLPGGGFTALQGYFRGFLALMVWGPLFAILHRLMMGTGRTWTLGSGAQEGSSDAAFTIATQSPLTSAHGDVALLAGYMTLLAPFAAAVIMRGPQAFAGLSQSFLNPFQSAAQGAAREASTGNVSLGNTSFGTHRFSSVDGNRFATSSFSDVGETSFNRGDGGRERTIGGTGKRVLEGRSADHTGLASLDFSNGMQSSFGRDAQTSMEQRDAFVESGVQSISALAHQIRETGHLINSGSSIENATGFQADSQTARSISQVHSNAMQFAESQSNSAEHAAAYEAYVRAAVKGGSGFSLFGNGATWEAEAGGKLSALGSARATELISAAENAVESDNLSLSFNDSQSASARTNASETTSEGLSFREGFAANLQSLNTASNEASRLNARSDRATTMESMFARDGANMSASMMVPFVDYITSTPDEHGNMRSQEDAFAIIQATTPANMMERGRLMNEFADNYSDDLLGASSFSSSIQQPTFEGFRTPSDVEVSIPSTSDIEAIGRQNNARVDQINSQPRGSIGANTFDPSRHESIGTEAAQRMEGVTRSIDHGSQDIMDATSGLGSGVTRKMDGNAAEMIIGGIVGEGDSDGQRQPPPARQNENGILKAPLNGL